MKSSRQSSLADIQSKAYLIYSEWGPPRQTPRDTRLADCYPEISEDTRRAWMTEFDQVEQAIWKVAEEGGPKTSSFEAFAKRMTKAFPFMNEEALRHAWTLADYYTWHEGY